MPKKSTKDHARTEQTFTRLDPDTKAGLDELAKRFDTTVSDLLRLAAKEMVAGTYLPSNFNPEHKAS